jgi:hypothetical protein
MHTYTGASANSLSRFVRRTDSTRILNRTPRRVNAERSIHEE